MSTKNFRIRTDVSHDQVVKTRLGQDVDFLEILSLKIKTESVYKLHASNYGIIVGRVLANEAFGIPNAKVSVFIPIDEIDQSNSRVLELYSYTTLQSKDKNNIRYNLLSDSSDDKCYRTVGTFPNKRLVLDNNNEIEIYEKYWKYTTVTNQSGDYMIYGVPTGDHQVHVDVDLSDIGILSQKPRDFIYKGYNITQFDNANQFKESTNLDGLSQLLSQNSGVHVYPFWGSNENDEIALTRCDLQVQYKFEPTCVFFGSIVSDNFSNALGDKCNPGKFNGFNRNLVAGEGTIEMIRKTPDGLIEEHQIQGNRLIDGNGVWCYQIPMNLDFVGTDEFGNVVPTDNPNKGIPTKTSVRFRFSMQETSSEGVARHRAKYLVPNVHPIIEKGNEVKISNPNNYVSCYEFGSATPNEFFRDLYWNKVYSVKNYIPRIQLSNYSKTQKYTGIRTVNDSGNLNPFPFNRVRFKLYFSYRVICIIMDIVIAIICVFNKLLSNLAGMKILWVRPFGWLCRIMKCVSITGGLDETDDTNTEYFPCCRRSNSHCLSCSEPGCKQETSVQTLRDKVQQSLAQEYDTVNLDFYNDWVNGCLYMPLWFWKKTKKKKYLFGLFTKRAVNRYCNCDSNYRSLKLFEICSLDYNANYKVMNDDRGNSSHLLRPSSDKAPKLRHGVIKEIENKDGLKVYYYAPGVPTTTDYRDTMDEEVPYVRLFSTDIILLGSLNDCDLDNLPRPFLNLPSTTANIPFITTMRNDESSSEETGDDKSGYVEVTGMDWTGHINDGLLMDMNCTKVRTKPKTCINVSRMSELGVSLDSRYVDATRGASDVVYNNIRPADGLITRYEIIDNETRAMFASLNHNGLTEKVFNPNTGYDTYKLLYMYPTDFDGHLDKFAENYTRGTSSVITYDYQDKTYVSYKFGPNGSGIYYVNDNNGKKMPLFNNSFYFYFGLNEGNTAIDKFNQMFYSACFQNNKYPFSTSYSVLPAAMCRDYTAIKITTDGGEGGNMSQDEVNNIFKNDVYVNKEAYDNLAPNYKNEINKIINSSYAAISIDLNDIQMPYKYTLYDFDNTVIIEESDLSMKELKIGYEVIDGGNDYVLDENNAYKKNGFITYIGNGQKCEYAMKNSDFNDQMTVDETEPIDESEMTCYRLLDNGTYKIKITDVNGNSINQTININQSPISLNVEGIDLGTKYYDNNSKRKDICNEYHENGEIIIHSFSIDGKNYIIKPSTIDEEGNITEQFWKEISLDDAKKYGYKPIGSNEKDIQKSLFYLIPVVYKIGEQNTIEQQVLLQIKTSFDMVVSVDKNKSKSIIFPDINDGWEVVTPTNSTFEVCSCSKKDGSEIPTVEETGDGGLKFNVWVPGEYQLAVTQICNNQVNGNMAMQPILISNGNPFNIFLNEVPLKFMLDDGNNKSSFYPAGSYGLAAVNNAHNNTNNEKKNVNDINNEEYPYLNGWFELYKEDTFMFPAIKKPSDIEIWRDFIAINLVDEPSQLGTNDTKEANKPKENALSVPLDSQMNIISYKFNSLMNLSKAAYVAGDNDYTFTLSHQGGKAPILYRGLYPMYDEFTYDMQSDTTFGGLNKAQYDSDGYVTCNPYIPNIVGGNYTQKGNSLEGANFNTKDVWASKHIGLTDNQFHKEWFKGYFNGIIGAPSDSTEKSFSSNQGNYFAAFTSNAGWEKKKNSNNELFWKVGKTPYKSIPYKSNNMVINDGSDNSDAEIYPGEIVDDISWESKNRNGEDKIIKNTIEKNTTNPHLSAYFIDRRVDYDMFIIMPYAERTNVVLPLYNNEGGIISNKNNGNTGTLYKDDFWKTGRIVGNQYNGIELAYDNRRNMATQQIKNKSNQYVSNDKYEYSFPKLNDSIELNGTTDVVNNTLKIMQPTSDKFRRLYEAKLKCGSYTIDIRNLFWKESPLFKDYKTYNPQESQELLCNTPVTVNDVKYLQFPNNHNILIQDLDTLDATLSKELLYNGIFSKDNYPTLRWLDISNIPSGGKISLELESCTYSEGINIIEDNNGSTNEMENSTYNYEHIVEPSGNVKFSINGNNLIKVVDNDMAVRLSRGSGAPHVWYNVNTNITRKENDWAIFSSVDAVYFFFSLPEINEDVHKSTTYLPFYLNTMGYDANKKNMPDKIIKTSPKKDVAGTYFSDEPSLNNIINNIFHYNSLCDGHNINWGKEVINSPAKGKLYPYSYGAQGTGILINNIASHFGPYSIRMASGLDLAMDDDQNVKQLQYIFHRSVADRLYSQKLFSIYYLRQYFNTSDDGLSKQILTLNHGMLVDVRDIRCKCTKFQLENKKIDGVNIFDEDNPKNTTKIDVIESTFMLHIPAHRYEETDAYKSRYNEAIRTQCGNIEVGIIVEKIIYDGWEKIKPEVKYLKKNLSFSSLNESSNENGAFPTIGAEYYSNEDLEKNPSLRDTQDMCVNFTITWDGALYHTYKIDMNPKKIWLIIKFGSGLMYGLQFRLGLDSEGKPIIQHH